MQNQRHVGKNPENVHEKLRSKRADEGRAWPTSVSVPICVWIVRGQSSARR